MAERKSESKTTRTKKSEVKTDKKEPEKKPFDKPIAEMPFEELVSLEGILLNELNWVGERCIQLHNDITEKYTNVRGVKFAGYDSMKEAEMRLNRTHAKMQALCTEVHTRIVNYIIEKWTTS